MTKNSLEALEQLEKTSDTVNQDVSDDLVKEQGEGDDPTTEITDDLSMGQMTESLSLADREKTAKIISIENENLRQVIYDQWRERYIPRIFWLVVVWLAFVIWCVGGQALHKIWLHNNVLIALVTTTTATIVGLFVIVANWLFPKPPKS